MVLGKNEIIAKWVHEYTNEMYRYVWSKISDRETAEDLIQNTFLAALHSFSSFEGKSSPKTWLFSILNHKILDYHREKYRMPVQVDFNPWNDSSEDDFFDESGSWRKEARPTHWDDKNVFDDHNFNSVLLDCLRRLPSKWFTAVQLKYLEGVDGDQISKELDITQANFWQILHRAKLQLRVCLDTNWFNS